MILVKSRIMISVLLLVVFFIPLGAKHFNNPVLNPNKKIGRNAKVLANTAIIRYKQGIVNPKNISIQNNSFVVKKQLLNPKQSFTFNNIMLKKASFQTHINKDKIIKAEEPLLRTFIVDFTTNETPEQFCRRIKNENSDVEIAEPYYLPETQAFYPDDPMAPQQDMLNTLKLYDAWEIEPGDSNVVIGISDVGVFQYHEDLYNSIAPNWNEIPNNQIDDDSNGYVDDFIGYDMTGQYDNHGDTHSTFDHGTNVAGIADATVNNGIGMSGVAYKCRFFPIKIGLGRDLVAGYESIIYAAIRGVKVLNCSWGVEKPYSDIDQSIINFAVAHDVSIVASAGNETASLNKNYPSAYHNVLAVGEVDQQDIFSGNNIGDYVDVLAPGGGDVHTDLNNGYSSTGYGSSYSSPVVAGVVALIRAKNPELDALQSMELARLSVDDVSNLASNYTWQDILPGRINALKAVTIDPFSIPSIRPEKVTMKNTHGIISSRFNSGDTVIMNIDAYNYLGDANNVRFVLSAVWDDNNSVNVIDSIFTLKKVSRESQLTIGPFKFIKVQDNYEKFFLRCDIYGDNNFHDHFVTEYIPSPIVTTFSNDVLSFSVSDRGTIGFGGEDNSQQGIGIVYKNIGNQVWETCFMAEDTYERFVSSLYWNDNNYDANDLESIKPFVSPDRNIGIFNDNKASQSFKIGLQVKQEIILPKGNYGIAKINIEVKNISQENIVDLSSGYFFDWDIKDSDSNSVELLPAAIPKGLEDLPVAVEMVKYSGGNYPVFACGSITYEANAEVQAAGLSSSIRSPYTDGDRFEILNSGTSIQDKGIFDAGIFIGMKFLGTMNPGDTKKYSMCFGGADTKDELVKAMKKAIDSTYSPVKEIINDYFNVNIYPQPANDFVTIDIQSAQNIQINISVVNLIGQDLINKTLSISANSQTYFPLNIAKLSAGNYFVKIQSQDKNIIKPLIIIK